MYRTFGERKLIVHRKTRYDLLTGIVKICLEEKTIMELFHETRTSYSRLKRELDVAIHFGLITNKAKKYRATKKGADFLNAWAKFQTFLKEE